VKSAGAFVIVTSLFLASCTATTPTAIAEPLTIQYTEASVPWLAVVYNCAGSEAVRAEQLAASLFNLQAADIAVRIGQPDDMNDPAYQIGSEDILIIVNPQNPTRNLTAEQVKGIFNGSIQDWKEINGSSGQPQVWVFAPGEDVQQIFEQSIMDGSPVTSMAKLATSMDQMSQEIANDVNSIGILPRHWKAGNVSEAYTLTAIPVLALTSQEPKGEPERIIACLQK
jgi:ABC-type phosphate transport system substrate-binding protein